MAKHRRVNNWKRLTRRDLPTFDDFAIKAIEYAMEHGGVGKISARGHAMLKNPEGKIMGVAANTDKARQTIAISLREHYGNGAAEEAPIEAVEREEQSPADLQLEHPELNREPTLKCWEPTCEAMFVTEGAQYAHAHKEHHVCTEPGCHFTRDNLSHLAAHITTKHKEHPRRKWARLRREAAEAAAAAAGTGGEAVAAIIPEPASEPAAAGEVESKVCSRCKRLLPVTHFHKKSAKRGGGLTAAGTIAHCKDCRSAERKSQRGTAEAEPPNYEQAREHADAVGEAAAEIVAERETPEISEVVEQIVKTEIPPESVDAIDMPLTPGEQAREEARQGSEVEPETKAAIDDAIRDADAYHGGVLEEDYPVGTTARVRFKGARDRGDNRVYLAEVVKAFGKPHWGGSWHGFLIPVAENKIEVVELVKVVPADATLVENLTVDDIAGAIQRLVDEAVGVAVGVAVGTDQAQIGALEARLHELEQENAALNAKVSESEQAARRLARIETLLREHA